MSQHLFSSEVGNKKFDVIMGWDNPTQSFFLIIFDQKSGEDYPVYTNLNEMMPRDLDYYVGKCRDLGIEVKPEIIQEVQDDQRLNIGNKVKEWN
ncbi:TPA: hypothetical protein ACRXUG_004591 [Pseudomonas aeruginosa]|uniref:hypothetical protein n=1 Tax=Pseudomonas aeruginosa group TaxID=136841 RepID=UPI0037493178